MGNRLLFLAGVCLTIFITINSQNYYNPFKIDKYPFIDYSKNKIYFFKDSILFENLFSQLDTIILDGTGKINIVHIGGSHVQADVYTHVMRTRLQTLHPGLIGSRGLIFPSIIGKTNNPRNFKVNYSGEWTFCKSTKKGPECKLGITGMALTTYDPSAWISIGINNGSNGSGVEYDFNKLKIFCETGIESFNIDFEQRSQVKSMIKDSINGYIDIVFNDYLKTVRFGFSRTDSSQYKFILYGLYFENDNPGITYSSVGVNGARFDSFLGCELFENQLKVLDPDLIIISIGTNDAYTRKFNEEKYKSKYIHFLSKIQRVAPATPILLTVPNDSYLYRRYINRNTEQMKNIIFELANKNNYGVWDFYSVMGGLNSSFVWQRNGLMNYDKIHFNKKGYILKGDLFFNAFLKAYDNHIAKKFSNNY